MNSRERIKVILNHKEADRIPLDLGGFSVTGMHVSIVYKLRQVLGLDKVGAPVKVIELYQMLGEIKMDLIKALGVDVVGISSQKNMFGFENSNWKEWTTFDGTPVLVPDKFNTEVEESGDLLIFPEGDKTVLPSGKMPKDGFYFDAIVRQEPIDDSKLNVEDNLEEFGPVSNKELQYFKNEVNRIYNETDKAIAITFSGTSFGDIALVPAPWLKHPKGIRDIEEWYISTAIRKDYVYKVFERQCEITLKNLQKYFEVVDNKVSVVMLSATDFGAQSGPFISLDTYRQLYKPFHKRINNWIHRNTKWKIFIHSCGSILPLIEDFIDAGFDILNPVQWSAENMKREILKERFGKRITFWGGGVNTQKTLPFGVPDEVCKEVKETIKIFSPGGGFVFNTIHNIQVNTPINNVLAMYETLKKYGSY